MVFSSVIFLFLFLPFVLLGYYLLSRKNIQIKNTYLLLASSIFYYFGEQNSIFIMMFVIALNFYIAPYLYPDYSNDKKTFLQKYRLGLLSACVVICIGLLWYFKYLNFSIELLNALFHKQLFEFKDIVLPLGISFYTFHALSYTFDVYYGRMLPEKSLLRFMTYVMMFPQLVAGPIVRYIDIKKQFYHRCVTQAGLYNGIRRFCYGLSKKVLLANTVSIYADKIFSAPIEQLGLLDLWLGAIAYALQIYFDFSGYSDMAIGLAMMFGFRYKENFNYPYIAKSASEFWRRWHISLSTWLRDYVYIPLGGNKLGTYKKIKNVLIVFILSGLWHGANSTFVCWGALYGIFIALETLGLRNLLKKSNTLSHIYLILIALTGWVIFRSDTMNYACEYLIKMYSLTAIDVNTIPMENNIVFAMVIGSIFCYDWRPHYKRIVIRASNLSHRVFYIEKLSGFIISVLLFVISAMSIVSSSHNPFIYFRF